MITLKVLMWKHLVVRIRRFIHTPIELVSPILMFILLFYFRKKLNPTPKSFAYSDDFNIQNTETMNMNAVESPRFIFYTPVTNLTESLMGMVGEKLHLEQQKNYPGNRRIKGYMPYIDDSELMDYSKTMGRDEAIVIFQNMKGPAWPERLNYTIRMNEPFMTSTYEENTLGPHERFGVSYEKFMHLQWAIDSSYLELLTGRKINHQIALQEFPYAESARTPILKVIGMLMPFVGALSLLLVFVFLVSRLLEERITGIQELIKMVGVSGQMLSLSHVLNVLPVGLLFSGVGTALLTTTANALVPKSSPLLVFIMMLLYFLSIVSLAFFCSYLAKSTQYAVTLATMSYIGLWVPQRFVVTRTIPRWVVPLAGLLPHAPFDWFWNTIGEYEMYGLGVTFSNMTDAKGNGASPLGCIVLTILQLMLFSALTWYMANVNPGPYSQAQPWNFVCLKQFWCPKKVMPEDIAAEELEEADVTEAAYFEPVPKNLDVGIRIMNVSKVFPKHKALTNVSFDVMKGEITVLLGHNGAGKTTLMSIITGMLNATEGQVYVEGLNTVSQKNEMRKHLGLCPQHNLFFPDLTILEHVVFFTMLKGHSRIASHQSSMELLQKLGLGEKANNKSQQLSGGMQRRLQLACALAGDASVLVLDEPTSGLDVETRRELWDLLLSLRGSRAVLLSTHFMEEADALGDRVAALHAGRLRCYATPMHLKRALGSGYRLTLTTLGMPKEGAISALVTSHVPDASVKETSLNTISYTLPAHSSKHFPKLFNALESKRPELGIETIGVGITTLEEVFLKMCSDVTTVFTEDGVDAAQPEPTYAKLTGGSLYFHQLCVLVKRQFRYILSRKISFFLLQVFLPILMIFLLTMMMNGQPERADPNERASMDLDLYDKMPERRVLYKLDDDGSSLRSVGDKYKGVEFQVAPDVAKAALRIGVKDIVDYNKYLVGVELNDTDAKVLYTTVVRHAAPVAVNLLSNVFAARLLPWADGHTIAAYNHPLEGASSFYRSRPVEPKGTEQTQAWASFIMFVLMATMINSSSLPCRERESGTRHLHVLAGAPAAVPWAATLLTHALVYTLILLLPVLLAAVLLEKDSTINQIDFLVVIFLVMFLGMLSFLVFMYLICFCFSERVTSIVLVAVIFIFGLIGPMTTTVMAFINEEPKKDAFYYAMLISGYLVPPHTFTSAAMYAAGSARFNAYCSLNRDKCPHLAEPGLDVEKCCVQKINPRCYLCLDTFSPGKEMLLLIVQFIVYLGMVVLVQRGTFNRVVDGIFNSGYKSPPAAAEDDTVRAEKVYVSKAMTLPKNQIGDALLVDNIHKNYFSFVKTSCNAVKGVSFSVKRGECFGLLGVNGAGKSTTFKMLTGVECPTRGNLFANGHFINKEYGPYLQSLGYCPQFSGLDDFLTGNENLTLLLTLQGLSPADVKVAVRSWIETTGLEKYANRVVSSYSGGCARRLATAGALCGGAAVTLLDEPSAGVDVAARRRMWAAVRRAAASGRSLIVSSHSMDETEALCSRIAIMSQGRVRALGSAGALRAAFASGHAVALRLGSPAGDASCVVRRAGARACVSRGLRGRMCRYLRSLTDCAHRRRRTVTDGPTDELSRLKARLHEKFNCTLKDEHKTTLHYHINETMRYSDLFTELEALRHEFPELLQDYSVTETTLEEVFLGLAREEASESASAAPSTPGPPSPATARSAAV